MAEETRLEPAAVRALADAADLRLDDERLGVLAPHLSGWLTAANELSRLMSRPEHQAVLPATVFTHPATEGAEE